jgi:hypothetical protein
MDGMGWDGMILKASRREATKMVYHVYQEGHYSPTREKDSDRAGHCFWRGHGQQRDLQGTQGHLRAICVQAAAPNSATGGKRLERLALATR